jgi:hypothetical protein
MKRFAAAAVTAVMALGAPMSASAEQYGGPGFSGDAYMAENNGTPKKMGTVHVDSAGFRMNMNSGGQNVASILHWDSDTVITLMLDQKMYMEIPPEQSGWSQYENKACSGYKNAKKIGSESVAGRPAVKWRCTGPVNTPTDESPTDATVWFDNELGFEIRMVEDDGNVFEVRNVAIGRQDASMFKIPNGYTKFDMNAMMQQMMQQKQ